MTSTIAGDLEEKEKTVEEFAMEKEEKGRKVKLDQIILYFIVNSLYIKCRSAVQCIAVNVRLGGAGLGYFLMGKLGSAWVSAWVGAWL